MQSDAQRGGRVGRILGALMDRFEAGVPPLSAILIGFLLVLVVLMAAQFNRRISRLECSMGVNQEACR